MTDFKQLKEWVLESWKAQAGYRDQTRLDFAFRDGWQWTDSEESEMEAASRAPVVFNRTAVIIASVAGSEINNRTEVRFIPREIGDVRPNEILTAGGEWFRDQANAEDAESEAFQNLLICGIGVTETCLDWEADPEGEPTIDNIEPLEFGWDCYARKKGLTDARYFFTVKSRPASEAKDRFPGKDATEIDADWIEAKPDKEPHETVTGDQYRGDGGEDDDEKDTLTIVQVQWRERVKSVEFIDPATGKKTEMPKDKFDALMKRAPMSIPSRPVTKWVWKQAFLGKDSILEENQPDPETSTFTVMTGHWDRKKKWFYGLLRSMRDPQKFANKWLSQTLHIINSNAKGGVMAEADAVEDQKQFEESWAAADGVTWMRPGAITAGRILEKPKAQMPAALMALTEFAITAIRETSGVNMELLGLRDANQPGVLEYQRRQSAMTTLAHYFDSLRFYRKRQGVTILNYLRNHIAPTGRLVRIVKQELVQYVPLAMADEAKKYDVIVDDAPQAPNEKEKAWSVIQAMMPVLQNAGLSMEDWADILEYSPLPSSFADKVRKKALEQKNQGPDPMQQIAVEKEKSEIAENLAQAGLDEARTQQIATQTRLAPLETAMQMTAPQRAAPA